MKFIAESPLERYYTFDYTMMEIFLDHSDVNTTTIKKAIAFCKKHQYGQEAKATAVYFLRGRLLKASYCDVLVGVLEAKKLPPELNEVIHCLSFWNGEGKKCYAMNKEKAEQYQDFILKCIAADCRAFVEPYADQFITGKGGRHVWITDLRTSERILMIHF